MFLKCTSVFLKCVSTYILKSLRLLHSTVLIILDAFFEATLSTLRLEYDTVLDDSVKDAVVPNNTAAPIKTAHPCAIVVNGGSVTA